ncbi:MAG: amidohydrolase family protein [Acidobacteria bacterium]|nr:amidohydrolase family protein [Acidobacteriota bacterium]
MKRHLWMAAMVIAVNITVGFGQQTADTILHNGRVLTVDANFSVAEAVAVRNSQILAVGTNNDVLRLAGPDTLRIDLKGRTVTPGLIHTHIHSESGGRWDRDLPAQVRHRYSVNFRQVKTTDDVIKQMKDIIAAYQFPPGEFIYFNTNPTGDQAKLIFDEMDRWELDKAAPDNPVAMSLGVPMQAMLLVNSKAIEALWAKHGDWVETYGRYWIDASGRPDGHFEPPAVRIFAEEFIPMADVEIMAPLYRKVLQERTAVGVTTISGGLHEYSVERYKWLDARGQMPIRYGYGIMSTFGIPNADMTQYEMGAGTDMLWITSMSARGVDGSGARMCISLERDSAAVEASGIEGEGSPSLMGLFAVDEWWPRGQCSLDIEYNGATKGASLKRNYFLDWYNEVARDGLRSGNAHMSGNDSHARFIAEMERIDRANPGAVKGWAMDHCTIINPEDIARAAKLGLMWSCEPLGERGRAPIIAEAFGQEIAHTYVAQIKTMLDAGINVSLEGGWPEIETLITRKDENGNIWGPDQRVDRATALRIATQNGANYVLRGDKLGSIEPGKLADLLVIDSDYMRMPEEDISDIQVLVTMIGGKVMFLHSDFSREYNFTPEGAVIGTLESLRERE